MFPPRKILVIDYNADSGALLVRTLSRKFPLAVIQMCKESATATQVAANERLDAIVLHRTEVEPATELVRAFRLIDGKIPIIAVSGVDRSEEVIAAGATGFLNYEEWLMIGTVVSNALQEQGDAKAETAPESSSGYSFLRMRSASGIWARGGAR